MIAVLTPLMVVLGPLVLLLLMGVLFAETGLLVGSFLPGGNGVDDDEPRMLAEAGGTVRPQHRPQLVRAPTPSGPARPPWCRASRPAPCSPASP